MRTKDLPRGHVTLLVIVIGTIVSLGNTIKAPRFRSGPQFRSGPPTFQNLQAVISRAWTGTPRRQRRARLCGKTACETAAPAQFRIQQTTGKGAKNIGETLVLQRHIDLGIIDEFAAIGEFVGSLNNVPSAEQRLRHPTSPELNERQRCRNREIARWQHRAAKRSLIRKHVWFQRRPTGVVPDKIWIGRLDRRSGQTEVSWLTVATLLTAVVILIGPLPSAVAAFATLAASLLRKLLILRETALLAGDTPASLAAGLLRKLPILRKAALLIRHTLTAFAGDLALLVFVHGSEAALGRAVSALPFSVSPLGLGWRQRHVPSTEQWDRRSDKRDIKKNRTYPFSPH
jgi:hypothetical protein